MVEKRYVVVISVLFNEHLQKNYTLFSILLQHYYLLYHFAYYIYRSNLGSNSILDQLTHLKAQGIYHNGGVPDSAMELS